MHELYLFYTLAAERGGASSGEGVQDGRPRRLSPCGLRPDEAVLDSGLRNAALLPDAEGKAAAYQSQGALPVKRRWSGGIWGRGGGSRSTKPITAMRWMKRDLWAAIPCTPPPLHSQRPLLPQRDCSYVCVV